AHVRSRCRASPVPSMSGSRATSTRRDRATSGTTATGRVRLMRAPTGSSRTTRADNIRPAAGKVAAATSTTIIAGTEVNSGTNDTIPLPTIATTATARILDPRTFQA